MFECDRRVCYQPIEEATGYVSYQRSGNEKSEVLCLTYHNAAVSMRQMHRFRLACKLTGYISSSISKTNN